MNAQAEVARQVQAEREERAQTVRYTKSLTVGGRSREIHM